MSAGGKQRGEGRDIAIPLTAIPLGLAVLIGIVLFTTKDAVLPVAGFYGTAAEIIPLLMVALALEARALEFRSFPGARLYGFGLFAFLLAGEICALLGASGALRERLPNEYAAVSKQYAAGLVAGDWSNLIAAGTGAGLIAGFTMLAVLAFSSSGWLLLAFGKSRGPKDADGQIEELREEIQALKKERLEQSA